jgi:hypothetical protein
MDAAIQSIRRKAEAQRRHRRLSALTLMLYICAGVHEFSNNIDITPASFGADYAWGHAQLDSRPDQAFPAYVAAAARPDAPQMFDALISTTGVINMGFSDKYIVIKHKYLVSPRIGARMARLECCGQLRPSAPFSRSPVQSAF